MTVVNAQRAPVGVIRRRVAASIDGARRSVDARQSEAERSGSEAVVLAIKAACVVMRRLTRCPHGTALTTGVMCTRDGVQGDKEGRALAHQLMTWRWQTRA